MPKSSTSPQPSSLVKETANGKGKAARDIRKDKAATDNSTDKGNSKDNNKGIAANDNSKDKQQETIANSGVNTVGQTLSQELKTTKSSTNVEREATEQCMVENKPSSSCNVVMANNENKWVVLCASYIEHAFYCTIKANINNMAFVLIACFIICCNKNAVLMIYHILCIQYRLFLIVSCPR